MLSRLFCDSEDNASESQENFEDHSFMWNNDWILFNIQLMVTHYLLFN